MAKVCKMYKKTILNNGVRLISEKLDYFRSISLGIWVGTGSRSETTNRSGISHFIEHMIFKGTEKRSSLQIAKELDVIGGFSNAFTGKEFTCFHARVLDKHFHILADIMSDIFLNSIFDPVDIDRERQVILQEIGMVEDTPDEYIHELFNRLYWQNHPLGRSVLGSIETISSIDSEAIIKYFTEAYVPENIIIAVAGNVDHDQFVGFFKPLFESIGQAAVHSETDNPEINSDISIYMDNSIESQSQVLFKSGTSLNSNLTAKDYYVSTFLYQQDKSENSLKSLPVQSIVTAIKETTGQLNLDLRCVDCGNHRSRYPDTLYPSASHSSSCFLYSLSSITLQCITARPRRHW